MRPPSSVSRSSPFMPWSDLGLSVRRSGHSSRNQRYRGLLNPTTRIRLRCPVVHQCSHQCSRVRSGLRRWGSPAAHPPRVVGCLLRPRRGSPRCHLRSHSRVPRDPLGSSAVRTGSLTGSDSATQMVPRLFSPLGHRHFQISEIAKTAWGSGGMGHSSLAASTRCMDHGEKDGVAGETRRWLGGRASHCWRTRG